MSIAGKFDSSPGKWRVIKKSKATKKLVAAHAYDTQAEAKQAIKDGRKYQKEYTWTLDHW